MTMLPEPPVGTPPNGSQSAAIIRECVERNQGVPTPTGKFGVWLDSPMIDDLAGPGTVEREFPGKFILYKRFGIDISKQPMLIFPTLHYQNGGLEFKPDAVREIARVAFEVNRDTENIGARRLHTVLERLLDEVLFDASDLPDQVVTFDAGAVRDRLAQIAGDRDLSRYIL